MVKHQSIQSWTKSTTEGYENYIEYNVDEGKN